MSEKINKKWHKRYGVKRERLFLMGHGSIIASPANAAILRRELDSAFEKERSARVRGAPWPR